MSLKKKIDFVVLANISNANPNGDPLNSNRPRTDYDDYGEISDVCIKRKIRNRMIDLGKSVFVQSNDKTTDEYNCLRARAESIGIGKEKKGESKDDSAKKACNKWLDVRAFGQVFSFKIKSDSGKKNKKTDIENEKNKSDSGDGVSIGIRGPVSIQIARSIDPVDIASMQITKSVSNDTGEKKGSDTMGMKHFVRYGLYVIKGSINPALAVKTGFDEDDADTIKECLRTLFDNDASSARPEGSMTIEKLYWFEQDEEAKTISSKTIHDSIMINKKEGVESPKSFSDYIVTRKEIPEVKCEEIEGN